MKTVFTKAYFFIVGCLFIYFTVVQFNDSDALLWILIYGLIALTGFINLLSIDLSKWNLILLIAITILFLFHIPILIDWINAGQPAFIDYEPTDIVEAEKMREFFGLFISLFSISTIYWIKKKSVKNA